MGARLLIIDEISLIGCNSLVKIHEKLKKIMIAWFNDPLRDRGDTNNKQILHNIKTLPFAGLHVLFAGFKLIFVIIYYK